MFGNKLGLAAGLLTLVSVSWAARVDVDFNSVPGRYLGRLEKSVAAGTSVCTATLVGPSLILTAAHCVRDGAGALNGATSVSGAVFKLHYSYGRYTASSSLEGLITGPGYDRNPLPFVGNDWVLAKLSRPLGLEYGWIDLAPETLTIGSLISAAGYSGDWNNSEHPGIDRDCQVRNPSSVSAAILNRLGVRTGNYYLTNCLINHGASGGPMVGWFRTLGSDGQWHYVARVVAVNHALDVLGDATAGITVRPAYSLWLVAAVKTLFDDVVQNARAGSLPAPYAQLAANWPYWNKSQQLAALLRAFPQLPQLQSALAQLKQLRGKP